MEFRDFDKVFQKNFAALLETNSTLFITDIDKDVLWNTYLDSFPVGTNELYRERREYDCNCCKQFIRAFGNVVAIKNNKMVSIWDFKINDPIFATVTQAMCKLIYGGKIKDVFVTDAQKIGTEVTHSQGANGVETWYHFHVTLPKMFMNTRGSVAETMGILRTAKEVFERALKEISEDSISTVLELIAQNSLYRGDEWREPLKKLAQLAKAYNKLPTDNRSNYCWSKSVTIGESLSRIKNHSIGVLLMDISEGMDLDAAVRRYERIVAPSNYKRPKAIFTASMIESAQRKLEELGFVDSLQRRYANLDDITINDIIYVNRDAASRVKGTENVFDLLKADTTPKKSQFSKVENVDIETFIKDIAPTATGIELYIENSHISNMVSLIAPAVSDSKTMFKWGNNHSWAYNGNIADSMKELVKAAGGNVEGVLRFTIVWNENGDNRNDFDAHCTEPNKNHIYFRNKGIVHPSSGKLDVDIIEPAKKQVAVENIIYTNRNKMLNGLYALDVHNFTQRGGTSGFRAEIEFDGIIHQFDYSKPIRSGETVNVGVVKYDKAEGFKLVKSLPSTTSSKEIWGIKTNQFVPVSVCMLSPNYWDSSNCGGNKHYFFMLNGCINPDNPNGFFNEFLVEELTPHRKVFEALGSKMKVADADDQLSGVGFSSTLRNSIICKVSGKFERIIKITF